MSRYIDMVDDPSHVKKLTVQSFNQLDSLVVRCCHRNLRSGGTAMFDEVPETRRRNSATNQAIKMHPLMSIINPMNNVNSFHDIRLS